MNRIRIAGLIPLALLVALPAVAQDAPPPKKPASPDEIALAVRTNDEAGVVLPALEMLSPKKGGKPDHPRAMKILIDAATKGNRVAAMVLTLVYMGAYDEPPNPVEQLKWNVFLAGDTAPKALWRTEAARDAGLAYYYGRGTPIDKVQAARWFRVAAEGGDDDAITLYAIQLFKGDGVPKNLPEAVRWLNIGADKGGPVATSMLAAFYEDGEGVPKDPAKALALYERAAAKGYRVAQYQAGITYLREREDPAKLAKGVGYVRQAAAANYPDAMGLLGLMYLTGIGLDKDLALSAQWLRKAAQGGNTRAMMAMIGLARESKCTAIPCEEVQDWIIKAADLGDPEGLYYTGDMYEKGVGKLARDPTKAIDCYRRAAALGNDKAKAALARLGVAP